MPQRHKGQEIVKAIREYLKSAVEGSEPITDTSLMAAADCSRRSFYKYVTEDSEIESEIKRARARQRGLADSPGAKQRKGSELIIARLRKELKQAEEGNRNLLEDRIRLIANLKSKGVSDEDIKWAQETPIHKPDRRVSRAGRPRRRAGLKR